VARLPLEWWAARLTGLATVDGLGAFACYQHAGVPLFLYAFRFGFNTPFCANQSSSPRRICSDSGMPSRALMVLSRRECSGSSLSEYMIFVGFGTLTIWSVYTEMSSDMLRLPDEKIGVGWFSGQHPSNSPRGCRRPMGPARAGVSTFFVLKFEDHSDRAARRVSAAATRCGSSRRQ
jgi:hypothetical protein